MGIFWQRNPALLYGLFFLLGCYFAFEATWMVVIPFALLLGTQAFTRAHVVRLALALLIFISAFIYVKNTIFFPTLAHEGSHGTIEFEISSLTQSKTHFGRFWVYKGNIRKFYPDSQNPAEEGRNILCKISLPISMDWDRPLADKSYLIKGRLYPQTNSWGVKFVIDKEEPWVPLFNTWSLAEFRYNAKTKLAQEIRKRFHDQQPAIFLTGMATGEFDDQHMLHEFGRFGLQHIMAISGFHFSIVSAVLSLMLGMIFSKKNAVLFLIVILSTYFLFLGDNPSIIRAWLTVLIALLGFVLEKRHSGLNSLGIALLAILIYNPFLSLNMGFQFSFLATAGILLLFQSFDLVLQRIFPKRSISQIISMNKLNQHGYVILACCRQGLALTIAVNLMSAPLILYYFHKFSPMSLLYNLFFPFMVSVSLFLLMIGGSLSLILPSLGQCIHYLNNYYTRFVLNYTYNIPNSIDMIWRVDNYPRLLLISQLCLVFYLGLWMSLKIERKQELRDPFIF